MNISPPVGEVNDRRLVDLLDKCLVDLQSGRPVDREAILADNPEIADELAEYLDSLQFISAFRAADEPLTPDLAQSLKTLGEYRLIREIGRGGMGVVYEAQQLSLDRRVALKVLPFASVLDPRHLQRFKNEALAAAHLDHPNIVEVYGVGCERGVHFYAMRYVEGQTLAAVIDGLKDEGAAKDEVQSTKDEESRSHALRGNAPLAAPRCDNDATSVGNALSGVPALPQDTAPPRDPVRTSSFVLRTSATDTSPIAALSTLRTTRPRDFFRLIAHLGIQAAEALDHAHQMGIVHRDIKPSNLMIECVQGPRSNAQSQKETTLVLGPGTLDPKLWITDFGLAHIETSASLTITGDLLGTLRYMSPEQAEGRFLDHRTDIYSLGVTLYELLTLRAAFPAEDRQSLLKQIANQEPLAPRKLNPSIPIDLETIALKATAKEAQLRYQSAGHFADDLRRFLAQQPVKARRASLIDRSMKWARRHPAVPVSTMCVLVLALLATLAAYRISSREQSKTAAALREKNAALQQAEYNFNFAQDAVDGMYTRLATQWIADNTAPTTLQQDFLKQAAKFYEHIVREIPAGGDQLRRVAVAYQRLGAIRYFLEEYAAASESLEHAIRLGEHLAASEPQSGVIDDLPSMYRLRAVILLELGDRDAARKAVDAGQRRLEQLIQEDPASLELQFEQFEFDHIHAELLAFQRQFSAAAACLAQSRQRLTDLRQPSRADLHLRVDTNLVENHHDLAKIHLAEGRRSPAREEFQHGLKVFERARQFGYTDFRPLAELQISLTEGLGEVAEQEGDHEQAVERYKKTLQFRGDLLQGGREPSKFVVDAVFKRQTNLDGQFEHGPFCAYIETQLRLSRALGQLGRPYEAEYRLGQSMLVMYLIRGDRPSVLRYHVAAANIWALTWKLLEEIRPKEAETARDQALVIWRRAMAQFPHAADYQSGVHGAQSDLAWFRSLLDDKSAALLTSAGPAPSAVAANDLPDIAFRHHAAARSHYDGEGYETAIKMFEASANRRDVDHAYPWLHIAMTQAKLGRPEVAREWFNRAVAAMDATDDADSELVELRGDAESLLTE